MAAPQPPEISAANSDQELPVSRPGADVDRPLQPMKAGEVERASAAKAEKDGLDKAKKDIWREENAALAGRFDDLRGRMKTAKPPSDMEKKQYYRELVNQVAREHQEMTPWMLLEGKEAAVGGVGTIFDKGAEAMTEKLWNGQLHRMKLETFLSGPAEPGQVIESLKTKLIEDVTKLAEGHKKQLAQKKQLSVEAAPPAAGKAAGQEQDLGALRRSLIEIGDWSRLGKDERKAKADLLNMTEADIDRSLQQMRAGELRQLSDAAALEPASPTARRPGIKRPSQQAKRPGFLSRMFGGKKAA